MGVSDPVELYYNNRRCKWLLMRGKETFYDENDTLVEFDTVEQAIIWAGDQGYQLSENSFPDFGVDAPE